MIEGGDEVARLFESLGHQAVKLEPLRRIVEQRFDTGRGLAAVGEIEPQAFENRGDGQRLAVPVGPQTDRSQQVVKPRFGLCTMQTQLAPRRDAAGSSALRASAAAMACSDSGVGRKPTRADEDCITTVPAAATRFPARASAGNFDRVITRPLRRSIVASSPVERGK